MQRLSRLALLLAACHRPADAIQSTAAASTGDTTIPPDTSASTSNGTALPTSDATEATATSTTSTTGSTTEDIGTGDTGTTGDPVGLRYDAVRQKSAHNSFQRDETLLDQIVFHRVRSLELDIHHSSSKSPTIAGEWYVYHIDIADDASHCRRLSQCLAQIAAAAQALPEHEVITLWIDLKDPFVAEHQPADLDALLTKAFGERLLTPADLRAACPAATNLREAVTFPGCSWPELAASHGRVIVTLTGGGLADPASKLSTYVGADASARAAFAAPDLDDPADLDASPAIFHNLALADAGLATAVRSAGLVSRVWVADDADAWATAEAAGVHHIASNKVNAAIDPWATTASPGGYPFTCIDGCTTPDTEAGAVLRATVDSGDLWADSDDALLATWTPDGDVTLTALLAVPSSHIEPFAKACLIARESAAPGAPYLAVCRPTDEQPLRVQLRETAGADSEAIELADIDGLSSETPAFARLERTGACVRGLTSIDGMQWTELGAHCFPAPLPLVGLTASSHDAGEVRVLFVAPTASPGGALAAGTLTVTPVGQAKGSVADGL
ncbi:MAG TPA: Ca2+-dependent phosphoinositide-specific phospholipase C [Nannocystis sp.]|jgi:hypothetical protein